MADVASLVVKVSTDGANKAQSELDKLAKQSSKTESATTSLAKSSSLLNVALSSIAIGTLLKESAKLADTYKLTEGRLSLVTKNTIELATAQQEVLKISQNTRQSYADTIDLYTRVARSTRDLGKSQADILKFTEIVNKSLVISGASAENSKAAIMQLGQALASGVLQGDELRSILENAPRLSEAIAKGMGKTVGELRILGEQGKLTAEEVFNAIQKQGDEIDKEFGKMPKTIGQATTQMGNSILELVGTMDKLTGASGFVADKISSLSKIMDDFSSNARVASSSVFEQKTVDDITIKANQIASEIQSLQTKLKENDGALWFGLDDRTQSEYINKIKRLEQQMEQLGKTAVDVLWKTSESTKSSVLSGEQVNTQKSIKT
jgi:tape measure domain-containing protein